jgi:hypothetical protein
MIEYERRRSCCRHRAQREVLARLEAESLAQGLGHVEGDDHRIVGVGTNLAYAQGVEMQAAHRRLRWV